MNSMTNDLEQIWQRLLDTYRRQKQTFGYHMEGNDPVWDGEDSEDVYTHEIYSKEQMP